MQEFDYFEINEAFPKVIVQCDVTLVLFEYFDKERSRKNSKEFKRSLQCNEETSEQIFFS